MVLGIHADMRLVSLKAMSLYKVFPFVCLDFASVLGPPFGVWVSRPLDSLFASLILSGDRIRHTVNTIHDLYRSKLHTTF